MKRKPSKPFKWPSTISLLMNTPNGLIQALRDLVIACQEGHHDIYSTETIGILLNVLTEINIYHNNRRQ